MTRPSPTRARHHRPQSVPAVTSGAFQVLFSERILLKMNNSSTLSTQFSTVTPRSILGFFCSDCLDLYICGERRSFSKATHPPKSNVRIFPCQRRRARRRRSRCQGWRGDRAWPDRTETERASRSASAGLSCFGSIHRPSGLEALRYAASRRKKPRLASPRFPFHPFSNDENDEPGDAGAVLGYDEGAREPEE